MTKQRGVVPTFLFCIFFAVALSYAGERERQLEFSRGFIQNKGQLVNVDGELVSQVQFYTKLPNFGMYITEQGMSYVLKKQETLAYEYESQQLGAKPQLASWNRIDMTLKGATIIPQNIHYEQPLKELKNYYLAHCPDGILNVKTFQKVIIKEVYPKIDWVFSISREGAIKYDFVVHPGGNPDEIVMQFEGGEDFNLLVEDKRIKILSALGEIQEGQLYSYVGESKAKVASGYSVISENTIGFNVGPVGREETLIIDPPIQLRWATVFGEGEGVKTGATGIATDNANNTYLVGYTHSEFYPSVDPAGNAYYQGTLNGSTDGWLAKFSPSGELLWSTYYGGSRIDIFSNVICAPNDDVFVIGTATSADFPVQDLGNGAFFQPDRGGTFSNHDATIIQFENTGIRKWATYYGGRADEEFYSIDIGPDGDVYCLGSVNSGGPLPTFDAGGNGYYQRTFGGHFFDAFLVRFNANCERTWATYIGGNHWDKGFDITTNAMGEVFVTGETRSSNFPVQDLGGGAFYQSNALGEKDAFLLKFNATNELIWGTLFGGAEEDVGLTVSARGDGAIYFGGRTQSEDFTTMDLGSGYYQANLNGEEDGFISLFDPSGVLRWSTYFGGSRRETCFALNNRCGQLYSVGKSSSEDYPTIDPGNGHFQGVLGGSEDITMAIFNANHDLEWSTYYGGTGRDWANSIAFADSCILVTGEVTQTTEMHTLNPGGGAYYQPTISGLDNGFVLKLCGCMLPPPVIEGDTAVCLGDSVLLHASGGDNYQWGDGTTSDSLWASPSTDSFYQVEVRTIDGCVSEDSIQVQVMDLPGLSFAGDTMICYGDTAELQIEGADNYLWENGETTDAIQIALQITDHILVEGTTLAGCSSIDSIEVQVLPLPTAEIVGDTLLCLGDTIHLTALGGTDFLWSLGSTASTIEDNPQQDQWYWVDVTENTCSARDSLLVSVFQHPLVAISGPSAVCQGDTLHLEASGASTFIWWNGMSGSGLELLPTSDTTVSVLGTIGNCEAEDSLEITLQELPTVEIIGDTVVCEGASTELIGFGADRYEWCTGEITDAITPQPISTTTFFLSGWQGECKAEDSLTVWVSVVPQAAFSFLPVAQINVGSEVLFMDNSTGEVFERAWAYGDGTTVMGGLSQRHIYEEEGSFLAQLKVWNSDGCADSTQKNLSVIDEFRTFLPNAFTPNGDGRNDWFFPDGIKLGNMRMTIYDRWGNLVYENQGLQVGWDGTIQSTGQLAQQGVYTYRLRVLRTGKVEEKVGHVAIVR